VNAGRIEVLQEVRRTLGVSAGMKCLSAHRIEGIAFGNGDSRQPVLVVCAGAKTLSRTRRRLLDLRNQVRWLTTRLRCEAGTKRESARNSPIIDDSTAALEVQDVIIDGEIVALR
jgi:hypothetical protein